MSTDSAFVMACRGALAAWRQRELNPDVQRCIDAAVSALDNLSIALIRRRREVEGTLADIAAQSEFKTPKDLKHLITPTGEETR